MFVGCSFKGLLIVVIASSGLASAQTKATSTKETQKPPVQTNPKPAEVYRLVTPADGIRFYSRFSSVESVVKADPAIPRLSTDSTTGQVNLEGLECGVIGDDQKEIGIALVSTTVVYSQIQTRDFGIIKIEMNSNLAARFFATESQIKRLRTLTAGSGK